MDNVLDTLEERGFLEQVTNRDLIHDILKDPVSCYIGFDPTAKSLHVGSLLPIMSLVHMQRLGHRPIIVIGGATALIGDPSGKTETRPIMTRKEIDENAEAIKAQLSRFINFDDEKAIIVNNADWLADLNYIDFLRDIGRNFSVNRMLGAESYRARFKTVLNFTEFNYMLFQAYDFWHLFKHYDCRLQMGGNDQWGNILAGIDLTRRLEGEAIHGITFPLLTTSDGIKMGKTHKGTVWLNSDLTSPYTYYQYWINQDDKDVGRFLALFTFLPMEEVHKLRCLEGADIRGAKEVLAYEATKICHGTENADKAREAAKQLFSFDIDMPTISDVPAVEIRIDDITLEVPAYILFEKSNLCKTRGEARRLIAQGGGYINGQRIQAFDQMISLKNIKEDSLLLRAGKKRYLKIDFV